MRVSHLSLVDFRNYETAELSLNPGKNIFLGRNGQGKTNLVEAIGYFATLRSHRTTTVAPLIRFSTDNAVLRMRVEASDRSVMLEMNIHKDKVNRAQINGNSVRPKEITRWFSSIAFVPEDLIIVRGEPSGRRRFLDDALILRLPVAAAALSDYERVVRQRTSLLKSLRKKRTHGREITQILSFWDDQLVEYGSRIMLARRELLRDLSSPLSFSYSELVHSDHQPGVRMVESVDAALQQTGDVSRETLDTVTAADVSRETLESEFRRALELVRERELERGVTLVGPHRDDVLFTMNGLPVKGYASHGESWSFALSLKLALANVIRTESPAGDPVIILDDVFAELDTFRRSNLLASVSDFEQVLVTAAVEHDVPVDEHWNRVYVQAGQLVKKIDDV